MLMLRTQWHALRNSRFSLNVLWNMGSMVVLAVGGVVMNSLILALRGEAALGIFNQVYAIYIVLSQIVVGGVQYSVLTYISYVQDDREQSADLALAALLIVTALSLVMIAAVYTYVPLVGSLLGSEAVAAGLTLALPGLLFFALNKVLINILNALQYMRAYALFRALRFVLLPAFAVGIILAGAPDATLALALTLTEVLLCIALLAYMYGGRVLPLRRPQHFWQHTRQHLSFGLRGVLTGVMTEMNTRIDVIMLGLVSSDALVGLYSFAAILAEGFAQFPIAVRYNVDPRLGQYFARDERAEITNFARRVRRYFWPGMLALGIAAALAYPVVFLLISDETGLAASWLVFILLAAGHVLTAGYSPFNGIILIGKLPGWQTALMLLITLSNIILNLLLIPPFGLFGAAIATSISAIIGTIGLVLVARVRLDVRL